MRDTTETRGLLADYCGLLREAAFLLVLMAESTGQERRDEFDALTGVQAESQVTYERLVKSLASRVQPDPREPHARRLTASVRALFGGLVDTGQSLLDWDAASLPSAIVDQCRMVESVSAALVRAWQERDPKAIERHLWGAQLGLDAIEQALEGGGEPAGTITATIETSRPGMGLQPIQQ